MTNCCWPSWPSDSVGVIALSSWWPVLDAHFSGVLCSCFPSLRGPCIMPGVVFQKTHDSPLQMAWPWKGTTGDYVTRLHSPTGACLKFHIASSPNIHTCEWRSRAAYISAWTCCIALSCSGLYLKVDHATRCMSWRSISRCGICYLQKQRGLSDTLLLSLWWEDQEIIVCLWLGMRFSEEPLITGPLKINIPDVQSPESL